MKKKKKKLLSKRLYNVNLGQEMSTRDEVKMQMGNVLKQSGSIGWHDWQWD